MNESTVSRLQTKTELMLNMQDSMNSRVDVDWIDRQREWYRAVWIECAELMDHYGGWKWWKDSVRDTEQAMLEIVDIWHFGLSMRLCADQNLSRAAGRIVDEWLNPVESAGFLRDVERLAASAVFRQEFEVAVIPGLLTALERDFDDLFQAYVGKNVLNFFRQDHGYKDGSYQKNWRGREDNEHLVEILAQLDPNRADYQDAVYNELNARYEARGEV